MLTPTLSLTANPNPNHNPYPDSNHNPNLQVLEEGLSLFGHIFLLMLFFGCIYAVLGVHLFGGTLRNRGLGFGTPLFGRI